MASSDPAKFIAEALKAHNECRARHGVNPLKHNSSLSQIAQSWANQIGSTLSFKHSSNTYQNKPLGENLAMWGSTGATRYDGGRATMQWYMEIKLYDFSRPGFARGTGHFTQVIWRDTREVGFGVVRGRDGNFYAVANYFPAGNYQGRFDENVPPPITSKIPELPSGEPPDLPSTKVAPSRDYKPSRISQQKFAEQALRAHNELRDKHCAPPLRLSNRLSEKAFKWAEYLASKDCLEQSNSKLNGENLGENVSMWGNSNADDYNGEYATLQWYNTNKYHDFKKEFNQKSSCFSQLVWKDSREVGFGVARAASGRFYAVANYYPAGNYAGQFSENVSK
jgi:glioma pathogenesis-related protein 2